MNRLSRKFIWGISAILLITIAVSLYINSTLIERYYIHDKKINLNKICEKLVASVGNGTNPNEAISDLEETEEVTIVWLDNNTNLDSLNEELRSAMQIKGIGFQKFWLWEQDYQDLIQDGRKIRIYNQGKLNYSLLVEYRESGTDFYAVAMLIPHLTDAIRIINTVTSVVMFFALLVAILLVAVLIKRITRPLDHMKQFADDIAAQKFHTIEIHTHDELETVAASMNQMCAEIEVYQMELLEKNQQMSELLDNVAHDLKTPVALIQAYAGGIVDNLDDGTFLDTIIRQNNRMSDMVENLLTLSRMKKQEPKIHTVALDGILTQLLQEQSILLDKDAISFKMEIATKASIQSNEEIVTLILSNLLSNAIKYTSGKIIEISLKSVSEGYLFEITNQTDANHDTDKLWEPFYVGEASRNKDLSGTGLGLALVKSSAKKIDCSVTCHMENGKIIFRVLFKSAGEQ